MGQYFTFLNIDKNQTAGGGKFAEFDGHPAALCLSVPPPFPKLEDIFKKIFGYDVPSMADRSGLGQLGRLPIELLAAIIKLLDIMEALVLGSTHGQLFVIGWSSISEKVSHVSLFDDWSYDRVICLGDYASTLPEGYLTTDEKYRLMQTLELQRVDETDETDENNKPDDKDEEKDATAASAEVATGEFHNSETRSHTVAAFKDQSFGLYKHSESMISQWNIKSWRENLPSIWELYDWPITLPELRRAGRIYNQVQCYSRRRWLSSCPPDRFVGSVLVNITKREYVRAVDDGGRYVFDDAIPLLTVWEDEMHGDWAGDRLALPSASTFEETLVREEGWKEKIGKWELE